MKTNVAVIQHNAGTDVEKNLSTLEVLSKQAAGEGARIICWAEAFAYLGRHEGKLEILEPLPKGGPILTRCKNLAKNLGIEILLGGFFAAFITGFYACRWMISLVKQAKLKYFSIYCFLVGLFAILSQV